MRNAAKGKTQPELRLGKEKPVALRCGADCLDRRLIGWGSPTGNEEIVIVHIAVHASAHLAGFRAEGRAPALQEDHHDDATHSGVGVRGEPAVASSLMRTGSGFAQDFFFAEVHAQTARGAVMDGAQHAIREFWDDGSNIELTLDA